jgi:ribosomal-protein-alanine N-acetyltransferase
MHIITQTPRIAIREFLPNEENTYLNHFTDEMILLYIPKRSREERQNIFRKALELYTVSKTTGTWGIFDKTTDDFIGSCLLRPFNDEAGVLEFGYSIERKYWGAGIGTEMAIAMLSHGFSDKETNEIVAVTEFANIASQRVLEKAGLERMDNLIRNGEELAYFKAVRDVV